MLPTCFWSFLTFDVVSSQQKDTFAHMRYTTICVIYLSVHPCTGSRIELATGGEFAYLGGRHVYRIKMPNQFNDRPSSADPLRYIITMCVCAICAYNAFITRVYYTLLLLRVDDIFIFVCGILFRFCTLAVLIIIRKRVHCVYATCAALGQPRFADCCPCPLPLSVSRSVCLSALSAYRLHV